MWGWYSPCGGSCIESVSKALSREDMEDLETVMRETKRKGDLCARRDDEDI